MDNREPAATPTTKPTLADLAFAEGRRLAGDPNICAVGYGIKLRAGFPAAPGALVFFVREKLGAAAAIAARDTWSIPDTIGGFATDVVEVGHLVAAAADRAVPAGRRGTHVATPLVGGVTTMGLGSQIPGPGGYGTMGGLSFDNGTSAPLLLSNAHVWGQTIPTEVAQPVTATSVFGAAASPATFGTPAAMVLTRVPPALAGPVAFVNSVAQTYLITGSDTDPVVFGQGATVPGSARTDREQVTIDAGAAAFPPAGRHLFPAPSWTYQRFTGSASLQVSSSAVRPTTKLLAARRLFTNAATYSTSQTVSLYAELIPAIDGLPSIASSHFPLVLIYPLPAGNKFFPRLLRPTARQTPTGVATQFTGFPAPARLGPVSLPFAVAGFTVDSVGTGTFQNPSAGTLPAGTLALSLPVGTVRLFVPPSTQVIIDIDLSALTGTLTAQAVSSAGDDVGTTTIPSPGANGRTLVSVASSEIVEVRLTVPGTAVLYGVTASRASPEATPPLCYAGSIAASTLGTGRWGASLFVQGVDTGVPESANVVETAIGAATLLNDCIFAVG
jgi:hypothetical protein